MMLSVAAILYRSKAAPDDEAGRRGGMVYSTALCLLAVLLLVGALWAEPAAAQTSDDSTLSQPTATADDAAIVDDGRIASRQTLIASLTIFVLAVLLGFELITKVPPTLHTPLMSGSNAISGITLVGAVIVAGVGFGLTSVVGLFGVILATVNVVGGFLVTHRMLAMFRKR